VSKSGYSGYLDLAVVASAEARDALVQARDALVPTDCVETENQKSETNSLLSLVNRRRGLCQGKSQTKCVVNKETKKTRKRELMGSGQYMSKNLF
jgi:hypothetical protein